MHFRRGQSVADGPLARLVAAALAPEAGPLTGDDIHLEIRRVTGRTPVAVIATEVVSTAVGFELIEVLKDSITIYI